QEDSQAFLRYLRQHDPGRPLSLLDKAPCHDALRSQQLAARLGSCCCGCPSSARNSTPWTSCSRT
ncbi:MAG TPA: hypothetical protein VKU02_02865, partial [Gemmataceae bacterium]|nr:hypothetical protein [Gemmataceae bacterium]